MNKKKGFTLIELLAVIIILGVLMIIAIPSVTEYILSSRKSSYVKTVSQFVSEVRNKVNSMDDFILTDPELAYFIPVSNEENKSCINLEKGGESPFGEWENAYVVVTYTGNGWDYYFIGVDSANYGMEITDVDDITEETLTNDQEIIFPQTADTIELNGKIYLVTYLDLPNCNVQDVKIEETPASSFRYEIEADGGVTIKEFYDNGETEVRIPDTIEGHPVRTVRGYSFENSNVKKVIIANSVTVIGEGAFVNTPIEYLKLGDSVETIGSYAFETSKITSLVIPNSVKTIGRGAFGEAEIKSLTIGNSVEEIGVGAFTNSKLTELVIPSSVKTIGNYAFEYSPLIKLKLSSGLETIGRAAFQQSQLTELKLPDTLITISSGAFNNSKLTVLEIPASVQTIEDFAFESSKISQLTVYGKGSSDCFTVNTGKFSLIGKSVVGWEAGSENNIKCVE